LIAAVPYKIHTVLTDNGIQFTFPPRYAGGPTARYATHMNPANNGKISKWAKDYWTATHPYSAGGAVDGSSTGT
jgi:hypothetical protein